MESFFLRYRNLLVLLALLLAQIIGLAVQVRRTGDGSSTLDPRDSAGVRLVRLWANALVSPPERLIHAFSLGAEHLWQNYLDLRDVRSRIRSCRRPSTGCAWSRLRCLKTPGRASACRPWSDFRKSTSTRPWPRRPSAPAAAISRTSFTSTRARTTGWSRDMAVITADGIVGKVRDVFPHSAQVLAINDQTSGAGVILETTRIRGILRGNADGPAADCGHPGRPAHPAGRDGAHRRRRPDLSRADCRWAWSRRWCATRIATRFIDVIVKPAAHLDRLDEVLVITSTQPRFSPRGAAGHGHQRSAQGRGSGSRSRKQKKASEIMAERLPGLIDPNLPADQQPLHDSTQSEPGRAPPQPLHPDRFTPGRRDPGSGREPAAASDRPNAGRQPKPAEPKASRRPGEGNDKPASEAAGKPATADTAEEPLAMSLLGADFRRDLEIHRYPSWFTRWCRWRRWCCRPGCRASGPVCLVRSAAGGHGLLRAGPPQPHPGHADGRCHGPV